ncbi:MAG: thiamine pyrophosphate-dependent dehydrogenase E1 component subunit alpha [Pelolinea sp.]|nr:thiamine pyrophosphate-dependent dehydrogenase E1 component subunit alpha [Pelolinea sp.]
MKIRKPEPPKNKSITGYEVNLLEEMYRRMYRIRKFELMVNTQFLKGNIPGTIHLSHGQEASAVGACLALNEDDFITITHRGHGQAIAKGLSTKSIMAELFGKATGCCKGKGGSLHIGNMSVGVLPAIAIVGASSPIAAGMAFAFKRKESKQIVCNFFGDGTANKGDWHEALNLAAIWSLPVIFLCENNLYGVSTHFSDVFPIENIADRAPAYGMPGITIYGNDPIIVYEEVLEAAKRARSGKGPTLVECLTYRQGGHKRDDPATYRPKEEVDAWLKQDPIPNFRERLLKDNRFSDENLKAIEQEIDVEIAEAVEFAQNSPMLSISLALEDVYAE